MTLHNLLDGNEIVLAPGIYDALSGLIATQTGAKAVYLSGASLAYTRFGRSDVGLVSVSEVHDTLAAVTDRIDTPVIVDADNGFGNALNVQRTVGISSVPGPPPSSSRTSRSQTLRSPGRQEADLLRRDGRKSEGRARCAAERLDPDNRAHRPALSKGLTPRSNVPRPITRPERTCCSSKRRNPLTKCDGSAGRSGAGCRCLPTWSRAARPR